ncbi:hypothetical protein GLP59_07105 [Sulfitobacter sp. M220]|jgi:hypothetical protein|uniref:hypothetical protein n=1 Tax=Sulfitobacter sp. M220 TaxID=2675333 RepID=UPI001F26561B|nr:hypothetical protein [Sulfitobacter sp. M220]MCF7777417.1 hypothetical protein [Sulfitobacter sp. M220]
MNSLMTDRNLAIDATAVALYQARIGYDQIFNAVIPLLAPQRRLFAEQILRGLVNDDIFNETFLTDLFSLIESLEREVAVGTQTAWVADEYCSHGGHYERHLDDRARTLNNAVHDLSELGVMIREALNTIKATRIVDELMED